MAQPGEVQKQLTNPDTPSLSVFYLVADLADTEEKLKA